MHSLNEIKTKKYPQCCEPKALVFNVNESLSKQRDITHVERVLIGRPNSLGHSPVDVDDRIMLKGIPTHDPATGLQDTLYVVECGCGVDVVEHVSCVHNVKGFRRKIKSIRIGGMCLQRNAVPPRNALNEIKELMTKVTGDDVRALLGEPDCGFPATAPKVKYTLAP